MGHLCVCGDKGIRDLIIQRYGGDRRVAAGHAFRHGDDVRCITKCLASKPGTCTAEAANNFIGPQKYSVFPANFFNALPITFRRDHKPAGTHNRLANKGGDIFRAQLQDFVLQRLRTSLREVFFAFATYSVFVIVWCRFNVVHIR